MLCWIMYSTYVPAIPSMMCLPLISYALFLFSLNILVPTYPRYLTHPCISFILFSIYFSFTCSPLLLPWTLSSFIYLPFSIFHPPINTKPNQTKPNQKSMTNIKKKLKKSINPPLRRRLGPRPSRKPKLLRRRAVPAPHGRRRKHLRRGQRAAAARERSGAHAGQVRDGPSGLLLAQQGRRHGDRFARGGDRRDRD